MIEIESRCCCPPHHWEVTSVRIDSVSYYHHRCKKCQTEKDIPLTASGTTKWSSRRSDHKH